MSARRTITVLVCCLALFSSSSVVGLQAENEQHDTSDLPYGPQNYVYDLVFLLDVSATTNAQTLQEVTAFIKSFFTTGEYTVSDSFVHVGLATVPGDGGFPVAIAPLNAHGTLASLFSHLDSVVEYADFSSGQQTLTAVQFTVGNVNFQNEGYRTAIKNHLAVYITGTDGNSFTGGDPASTLAALRQAGTYGIVTINYKAGNNINTTAMQALSGGASCSFSANDADTLNGDVVSRLQQLIRRADNRGAPTGQYC